MGDADGDGLQRRSRGLRRSPSRSADPGWRAAGRRRATVPAAPTGEPRVRWRGCRARAGRDGAVRGRAGRRAVHSSAEPEGGDLGAVRAAGRHDHGDPGRHGHRHQHGRRPRRPRAPGCRRTRRHHRGPAGAIAFGNPAGPNAPARCATLIRYARPVGELSAQAVSTRPRSPAASATAGSTSSGSADRGAAELRPRRIRSLRPGPSGPSGPSCRRHSFRATACSQASSRSGSRSPSSFETAMIKVSWTTSAASGPGSIEWQ